jgi:hypothetical protein
MGIIWLFFFCDVQQKPVNHLGVSPSGGCVYQSVSKRFGPGVLWPLNLVNQSLDKSPLIFLIETPRGFVNPRGQR